MCYQLDRENQMQLFISYTVVKLLVLSYQRVGEIVTIAVIILLM